MELIFNARQLSRCPELPEITHVGRNLLLRLLNSGEIPAFKMGKLWKVYKQDLIQYMSQCQ